MSTDDKCPRCSETKNWSIRRKKRRCIRCRYEWQPGRLPLQLSRRQWQKILSLFFMGLRSEKISQKTRIERRRVLRALKVVRERMAFDIPAVFRGHIQGRPLRKNVPPDPVFGILCRSGLVWTEIVPNVTGPSLIPLINHKILPGSVVSFIPWRSYTGLVVNGSLQRLTDSDSPPPSLPLPPEVVELETFWGYLKPWLMSRGGVRRERLHLYLAEYNWRYNHRDLSAREKVDSILNLLSV